jgi:hypothetical protein
MAYRYKEIFNADDKRISTDKVVITSFILIKMNTQIRIIKKYNVLQEYFFNINHIVDYIIVQHLYVAAVLDK